MKKLDTYTTTTYDCGGGFRVDIVTNREELTHGAFIYHKTYGVKNFMFGVPMASKEYLDDFILLVDANIEEYKQDYIDEYMNE